VSLPSIRDEGCLALLSCCFDSKLMCRVPCWQSASGLPVDRLNSPPGDLAPERLKVTPASAEATKSLHSGGAVCAKDCATRSGSLSADVCRDVMGGIYKSEQMDGVTIRAYLL
jgi:hypothetical protein